MDAFSFQGIQVIGHVDSPSFISNQLVIVA
jgi:hypothetical protein